MASDAANETFTALPGGSGGSRFTEPTLVAAAGQLLHSTGPDRESSALNDSFRASEVLDESFRTREPAERASERAVHGGDP